ncbi:MAG: sodium:proton antiporter [Verrucomicrobiales bacterium]|jgi:CPA1 family monovalent cation:H+ antiporter|nr:sodium:proton antiporter [Verrucomicrobiales bacterium]
MSLFELIAVLLAVAALLGYLNIRYLKLPTTIGIMLLSLLMSLVLVIVGLFVPGIELFAESIVSQIDFGDVLLDVMLSYLLFAGALHVDLSDLSKQKWVIALMATVGVLISTVLVGTAAYYLLPLFGFETPYIYCLLFGALISPTDPVAVLGILKRAGVGKSLETKITGESLFNDGVGVVVFLALLSIATGKHEPSLVFIAELFAVEVIGGIAFGVALGFLGYYLLKRIDNYQVEVLITLALVTGGYTLASHFHLSGPLAMVVSGLMIGNHGRLLAMSDTTRKHLDLFWELIDEILNALLFALIGFELLIVANEFSVQTFILGLIMILVVLACRAISVSIPVATLSRKRPFSEGAIRMLTWGGLRGGISVALALALPAESDRSLFLKLTYMVVIFSIAVQGLTISKLYQSIQRKAG